MMWFLLVAAALWLIVASALMAGMAKAAGKPVPTPMDDVESEEA